MRLLAPLVAVFLSGCVYDSAGASRSTALSGYQSAIRWNHFDQAMAFQNGVTRPPRATDRMRNSIRVTRYDVLEQREDRGGQSLHQTVRIRYHHLGESTDRDIIDEQDWRFDENLGRWVIDTPLPRFQ